MVRIAPDTMKILPFYNNELQSVPSVVTIGVFDGLHRGHQKIIGECVRTARGKGAKSVVITFSVNPKMFCGREEFMKPIITDDERNSILEEYGVDYLVVIDFSAHISKMTGEEFIAELCTLYKIVAMVVGSDFRCGNKTSSVGTDEIGALLTRFTSSAFLTVVPVFYVNGEAVSSSLIRRCLLTGDFDKASSLLGRPYIPY